MSLYVYTTVLNQLCHRWIFKGLHVLANINNVVMNVGVQISLQDPDLNSFAHTPKIWDC